MFTKPTGTPSLGFASKTTPVPANWFNYVSNNFPDIFDATGGGTWQNVGDIVFKSSSNKFKLNYPDINHQIELRGFVTIGLTDIGGMPTGAGALTIEVDTTVDAANSFTSNGAVVTAKGITATNSTANGDAIGATGNGTGRGISATGGTGGGEGVFGQGATGGGGVGVAGLGDGSAAGGSFQGGVTGVGIVATAGGGNTAGVRAFATGTGPAVDCQVGGVQFNGTQPAKTADPGANMAHATNQAKAWAHVTTDGAGNYTILDGYNIATVTLNVGYIRFDFARAMSNANYAATGNECTGGAYTMNPRQSTSTTSYVEFILRDSTTGTVIDPVNSPVSVAIHVHARQ